MSLTMSTANSDLPESNIRSAYRKIRPQLVSVAFFARAVETAHSRSGRSGIEALSGSRMMESGFGNLLRTMDRNARSSIAAPSPTAPARAANSRSSGRPIWSALPAYSQVRGHGKFSMSSTRLASKTLSRSGRNRMKLMSVGGVFAPRAHSLQSFTVGSIPMTAPKRDSTGARMPVTPARSVRRLVAATNVMQSGSLWPLTWRARSNCM